jgi:hypothetical protein
VEPHQHCTGANIKYFKLNCELLEFWRTDYTEVKSDFEKVGLIWSISEWLLTPYYPSLWLLPEFSSSPKCVRYLSLFVTKI